MFDFNNMLLSKVVPKADMVEVPQHINKIMFRSKIGNIHHEVLVSHLSHQALKGLYNYILKNPSNPINSS